MIKKPIKAVSLISGGLDSLLSTKLIIDQGVHVEGINFFTGFCVEGHTHESLELPTYLPIYLNTAYR